MTTHKISASALSFVLSREKNNSGADFTIKSLATSKDYTYQISRKKWKDNWYTHVSVEMGYLNFVYLGTYFKGAIRKKGSVIDTPSAVAIAWVLSKVEEGKIELLDKSVDIMHKGACLVCGATLTDAFSIETGLGPVCGGNNRGKKAKPSNQLKLA